jgi:hypothetical protein
MFARKHELRQRLDDDRPSGGGGGGATFDLEYRLSQLIGPHLKAYAFRRRLLALFFTQPDAPTFRDQVKPKLDYWHFRSGHRLDFMCVGYSAAKDRFDAELFARSVQWMQARSAWQYGGESDLVLLNAVAPKNAKLLHLETDQVVSVALEHAVKEGAIRSVPYFMERVFTFAESYTGDDPAWGFSDHEGKRLAASGLKALLLSCLPKSLRKDARAAFHFCVREHVKPAA